MLPGTDIPYPVGASLPQGTSATAASIPTMSGPAQPASPAAQQAEAVRVQRLREDSERPMSVNLAEGIALSHKLMRFAGCARKSEVTEPA